MHTLVVILIILLIFLIIPAGRKVILFILSPFYLLSKYYYEAIEGHMKKVTADRDENPGRYKRSLRYLSPVYSLLGTIAKQYEELHKILTK